MAATIVVTAAQVSLVNPAKAIVKSYIAANADVRGGINNTRIDFLYYYQLYKNLPEQREHDKPFQPGGQRTNRVRYDPGGGIRRAFFWRRS